MGVGMLSKQSVTTLVDILENRISMMEVTDRDDLRELSVMKRCLAELSSLAGTGMSMEGTLMAGMMSMEYSDVPRRGRRRKVLMHA